MLFRNPSRFSRSAPAFSLLPGAAALIGANPQSHRLSSPATYKVTALVAHDKVRGTAVRSLSEAECALTENASASRAESALPECRTLTLAE